MSSVRFELDINGLRELMKSGPMQEALQEAGKAVAGQGQAMSGEEYTHRIVQGEWVSICQVFPVGYAGYKDSVDNNTALKALGSAGIPMSKK